MLVYQRGKFTLNQWLADIYTLYIYPNLISRDPPREENVEAVELPGFFNGKNNIQNFGPCFL